MKIQRPVRLSAMKEHRDGNDRDVGRQQGVDHDLPAAEIRNAMAEPLGGGVQKGGPEIGRLH